MDTLKSLIIKHFVYWSCQKHSVNSERQNMDVNESETSSSESDDPDFEDYAEDPFHETEGKKVHLFYFCYSIRPFQSVGC